MKSLSRYRAPCVAIIALTVLLTPTWGQKSQTDPKREVVGFVEDVKGDWFLDDKLIPSKGKCPVPAGSILRAKTPRNAAYSRVLIAFRDCTKPIDLICDRQGNCGEPIKLPAKLVPGECKKQANEGRATERALRSPSKYESLCSNCRGAATLSTAVVQLAEAAVDLTPVFERTEGKPFLLQFEPIPHKGALQNTSLGPVRLRWNPGERISISVKGLRVGLYRIGFLEPETQEHEPTGEDVWVLITDRGRFEKLRNSFQQAVELSKRWSNDLTPDRESFLRAYLEALAEETGL